jgi:hypothetical protein
MKVAEAAAWGLTNILKILGLEKRVKKICQIIKENIGLSFYTLFLSAITEVNNGLCLDFSEISEKYFLAMRL